MNAKDLEEVRKSAADWLLVPTHDVDGSRQTMLCEAVLELIRQLELSEYHRSRAFAELSWCDTFDVNRMTRDQAVREDTLNEVQKHIEKLKRRT